MDYICYLSSYCAMENEFNQVDMIATESIISNISRMLVNALHTIARVFLNISRSIRNGIMKIIHKIRKTASKSNASNTSNPNSKNIPRLPAPKSIEELHANVETAERKAKEYQETANDLLDQVNELKHKLKETENRAKDKETEYHQKMEEAQYAFREAQWNAKRWEATAAKYSKMLSSNEFIGVDHLKQLADNVIDKLEDCFRLINITFKNLSEPYGDNILNTRRRMYTPTISESIVAIDEEELNLLIKKFIMGRESWAFDNSEINNIDQRILNLLKTSISKCEECSKIAIDIADKWEKESMNKMHNETDTDENIQRQQNIKESTIAYSKEYINQLQKYSSMLNAVLSKLMSMYVSIDAKK